MKASVKIIFSFFLILTLLFLIPISAQAKEIGIKSAYEDKASAIYLYSYEAKSTLYLKGENKLLSPASTVKIMTGLIACERLSDKFNESVTVTAEMLAGHEGTSMGLEEGMTLSVKDLVYGTVCGGNNDAAQALAIYCSGSIDSFVEEMNEYASTLGMTSTVYKNPTGLDAEGAQTTISDVAIISKKAIKNDLYKKISSAKSYDYTPKGEAEIRIYNRNALISNFSALNYLNDSAYGLIAGATDKAGYVVSTYLEDSGSSYLCIVMGAQADGEKIYSYEIASEIFEKALNSYSYTKVLSSGSLIAELPVENALTTDSNLKISCVTENDIFAYLPDGIDLKKDLEYKPYLHDKNLSAPISEGDVIGGINIYYNGELVGTSRAIADQSVDESEFLAFMNGMKAFFVSRYFLIFLAVLIFAVAVFVFFDKIKRKKRRRNKISF